MGRLSVLVVCGVLTLDFSKVASILDWNRPHSTLALVHLDRTVAWLQVRESVAVDFDFVRRLQVAFCVSLILLHEPVPIR